MSTAEQTANNVEAHALLKSAHDRAWRFPKDFPGLSADIEVQSTGEEPVRGSLKFNGPRDIELTLDASEEVTKWANDQVTSMIGHRWARAYEDGDGRYDLVQEDDGDPRGPLLRQLNDPFTSSYRVRDNAITVVNRTMGTTSFSISTQEHIKASDGRSLPRAFSVSYRDTETNALNRIEIFQDTYTIVDGMDMPESRQVSIDDGTGVIARRFILSNIKQNS